MSDNLFDILQAGITDPVATAIETVDGRRITYADLVARTGCMANALVGLGVVPGDRVAVQVEKSVEAIILYLATVRAGAVFLPLNTAYTPAEVRYFVGDAQPRVFVCDPAKAQLLAPIAAETGARLMTLNGEGQGTLTDEAENAPAEFATVARDRDDLAALLYTSGTTGRSRARC